MKILITGGSGFIGTRLVGELLKAGHQVTIFDKNNSSKYPEFTIVDDVREKDALIKAVAGHDVIYHLAAEHADDVRPISLYHDVNVIGAKNLLAAADNAGINKIIFTSSVAVYPLNAGEPNEDSPVAPFNEYGKSKYVAEQVFEKWVSEDASRSLTIVRPCVIFGEDNRGNVYNLLSQIYKNKFIMIGAGRNKKSMGYVGNIAHFLTFALDFGPGFKLLNYADKPDLTTNELIGIAKNAFGRNGDSELRIPYGIGLLGGLAFDLLANISGKSFSISSIRIKKFCADTTISTSRLLETDFKPPCTLKQALEQTIKTEFSVSNK
ncbi:MAG: NAD(P)-dependent oxidoreductase [Planctomycetes bacterium]|nr:NAD(P)-dependent oxidoreductase [Planctomycetota bacterium]